MENAQDVQRSAVIGDATYSADDNKLRLYPLFRLDKDLYERVRAAGFIWAPKQELFVAPMWTPERHDLLVELCGEIGDEDTTLVDRAEERAERFEDYSEKRQREANYAHEAVAQITDGIPLGQPILVGHHSERRARKDAERIEQRMRKAVKLWETAEYWQQRAKGAIRAAKYKERPDVRARRIKTIEAEKRKQEKRRKEADAFLAAWQREGLTLERALAIANYCHLSHCFPLADYPRTPPASQYEGSIGLWSALKDGIISPEQARDLAVAAYQRSSASAERSIAHLDNRLVYERAMLADQGGLVAENITVEPGGRVLINGEWATIIRVTKKNGKVVSVRTNARYCSLRQIEEISDYQPPTEEAAKAVKTATTLPPLCNYPGEGFHHMTKAEWDKTYRDYKGSRELGQGRHKTGLSRASVESAADASNAYGRHRVRVVMHQYALVPVYLTDVKRTDPPVAELAPATSTAAIPAAVPAEPTTRPVYQEKETTAFDALREHLRHGVQAVSAPQLFPTPTALAQRMVQLADIRVGHRVLEPSAGTGRILAAIRAIENGSTIRTAVEINANLCAELRRQDPGAHVFQADFLQWPNDPATTRQYDRIIMNPPFGGAQDIAHIQHAISLLAPGGLLVALCANGPRQNAQLKPLVVQYDGDWEQLPSDTFQAEGTSVSSVLLWLSAPESEDERDHRETLAEGLVW